MNSTDSADIKYKTALYLCHLIRCALEDSKPSDIPEGVDLRQVYILAKHNSVEGIAYYGASKNDYPDSSDLMKKWRSSLDKTILKQVYFDSEREEILKKMRENGLSYILLKGINIQKIYPKAGMRSMADNDILFGFVEPLPAGGYTVSTDTSLPSSEKTIDKIMSESGFEIDLSTKKDLIYHKKPFYNFEMHKQLVEEDNSFFSYYENPWKRAFPVDSYEYTYSSEDEYIYIITHMYHHFFTAGCGIRNITDIHVFLSRFGRSLDMVYIKKEFDKLGISSFHDRIVSFTNTVFSDNTDLDKDDKDLLLFITGCGTFGNMESFIKNRFEKEKEDSGGNIKKAKFLYIKNRVFLSRKDIKKYYPFFHKYPVFIPLLFIFRLGRGILFKANKTFEELIKIIKK